MRNTQNEFFAQFDLYTNMAYYVAKTLHMRPNDILDNWSAAELVVTFGEYANEDTYKNYQEWKSLDQKTRATIPMPNKYIVYFHGDLAEDVN